VPLKETQDYMLIPLINKQS